MDLSTINVSNISFQGITILFQSIGVINADYINQMVLFSNCPCLCNVAGHFIIMKSASFTDPVPFVTANNEVVQIRNLTFSVLDEANGLMNATFGVSFADFQKITA